MSECAFCEELLTKECGEVGNRVIWENDDFMVIPTVGCFTAGYVMLMPKEHTYSMAQLDPELITWAATKLEPLRYLLSDTFGKQILVAEHGALSCAVKGAQCCDHAHLHFIPVGDKANMNEVGNLYVHYSKHPPDILNDFTELVDYDDTAYILASFTPKSYHVWDMELAGFRSQFCRWAAAKTLGIEERYNWKTHPGWDNMRRTIDMLRGKLRL